MVKLHNFCSDPPNAAHHLRAGLARPWPGGLTLPALEEVYSSTDRIRQLRALVSWLFRLDNRSHFPMASPFRGHCGRAVEGISKGGISAVVQQKSNSLRVAIRSGQG